MTIEQADLALPRRAPLRSVTSHPVLMHYHRLVAAVVLANLAVLCTRAGDLHAWARDPAALAAISNAVLANFAVAVLARQQLVINLLFRIATLAPTSWPLALRWHLGKVYHFGGLHSGCATAATAWFAVFTGVAWREHVGGVPGVSATLLALCSALVVLLLAIVALALPKFRSRFHDRFELMHRFGGWSALALFWAQTLVFAADRRGARELGDAITSSGAFWVLVVLSASIAAPWLRLRRVPVVLDRPSKHAVVVRLAHTTPFPGSSTALSRNPLVEWHSFANIPAPGEAGFRLIVSRAGDWTGRFIDDLPSHVWVKGITTAGVANIETLFKRVVYVATGSGIGPVMPHLLARRVPIRLIWSTRSPRRTYGDAIVDEILAAQPDALIWDTDERGKPDLVRLALDARRAFGAEAVICIANQKLTRQVVYEMESRGIPAYGAIWDS